MSLPNDPNPSVSLQKPSGSLPNQPPDLPPLDNYGSLLPQLLSVPRKCNASAGMGWITKAFTMFKKNFLLWIGIGVVYLIISLITGYIPIINLLFALIVFVFIGGVIQGCAAQAAGKELRFDYLFSAFKTHFMPLIILCLLYIVAVIIAFIPIIIIFLGAFLLLGENNATIEQLSVGDSAGLMVAMVLSMLIILPIIMSIWFAPALVVLHNIKPFAAMKMSLKGCLTNIVPFLVFVFALAVISSLLIVFTLGLALLVVVPVGMITYYTSYRDVWTDQPLSAA